LIAQTLTLVGVFNKSRNINKFDNRRDGFFGFWKFLLIFPNAHPGHQPPQHWGLMVQKRVIACFSFGGFHQSVKKG